MQDSKLYRGNNKTLYYSEEENSLIMSFEDDLAIEQKVVSIPGKGIIKNHISTYLMSKLDAIGIEHHLIEKINMRQQLIQYADVLPIQVLVSNIALGRYVEDFGIDEGFVFDAPIIDFRVKNHKLNYPIINEHQIEKFDWASAKEIRQIKELSILIYSFLVGLFAGRDMRLLRLRLEFGRVFNGEEFELILTDEISPETCLLWDLHTNEPLSHEATFTNIALLPKSYPNIAQRLGINIS